MIMAQSWAWGSQRAVKKTILKGGFRRKCFPKLLQNNFSEQLFYRALPGDCILNKFTLTYVDIQDLYFLSLFISTVFKLRKKRCNSYFFEKSDTQSEFLLTDSDLEVAINLRVVTLFQILKNSCFLNNHCPIFIF